MPYLKQAFLFKLNFQKHEVFVAVPYSLWQIHFVFLFLFVLTLAFGWHDSFVWKCWVFYRSMLNLNGTPIFQKSFFVFQRTYFKVKAIKPFRISCASHMKKIHRSLKWMAILKRF